MAQLCRILVLLMCVGSVAAQVVMPGPIMRTLITAGGGGSIQIISTNSNHTTAEGTSLTCNISGTVLANDIIIIGAVDANVISTPSGYTQGNTFPDDCEAKVFWKTAAGGETSVAVTTLTGHGVIFVLVARNIATSTPVDQTQQTLNQTDPLSAGTTGTLSQADELVIAMGAYPAPGGLPTLVAGPAGYESIAETSTGSAGSFGLVAGLFAYKIVAATTAVTASFDLSSATPGGNSGSGGITTFKKAP